MRAPLLRLLCVPLGADKRGLVLSGELWAATRGRPQAVMGLGGLN